MNGEAAQKRRSTRKGWSLFWRWGLGVIGFVFALQCFGLDTDGANVWEGELDSGVRWGLLAGLRLWQAWLVFPPVWRWAGWIAIPFAPLLFYGGADDHIQTGIDLGLLGSLEAALFIKVRRNFAAWLFARGAALVFYICFAALSSVLGADFIAWFLRVSGLPLSAGPLIGAAQFGGIWIGKELIVAAVLAWWMPPISEPVEESAEVAPKPPAIRPSEWPVRRASRPRKGVAFFWLWIGASMLGALLFRLVAATRVFPAVTSNLTLGASFVYGFVAVAQNMFQSWLLCCSGVRMAGWVVSGLAGYFLGWIVLNSSVPTHDLSMWIAGMGMMVLLVRSLLLIGVRQRPWLWLLAGLAGFVLQSGAESFVHQRQLSRLFHQVAHSLPMIGSSDVGDAVVSGAWLLGEITFAAALAWLMPPVVAAVDEPGDLAAKREA